MKLLISKYKILLLDKVFITSLMTGLVLFSCSLFVSYRAINYTVREEGNATTDVLLQNLPVVDTDIIFSEGALVFVIFLIILIAVEPKKIPFVLKSIALFILIRSVFISMTHLAPYPDRIVTDMDSLPYISAGTGLFFSGHTGLPFLFALMYWGNKYLRWIFLFCSVAAAVAVILGHLHYTIDVFSAFFISYGIYHIAQKTFKKDYKLFHAK